MVEEMIEIHSRVSVGGALRSWLVYQEDSGLLLTKRRYQVLMGG
jgi:hypothetical protein